MIYDVLKLIVRAILAAGSCDKYVNQKPEPKQPVPEENLRIGTLNGTRIS